MKKLQKSHSNKFTYKCCKIMLNHLEGGTEAKDQQSYTTRDL